MILVLYLHETREMEVLSVSSQKLLNVFKLNLVLGGVP
jgi:hypothetical protein